jgi:hypothetical protein
MELDEEKIQLLKRFSPEFRERHIVTRWTGDLVAVDSGGPHSLDSLAAWFSTSIERRSLSTRVQIIQERS